MLQEIALSTKFERSMLVGSRFIESKSSWQEGASGLTLLEAGLYNNIL